MLRDRLVESVGSIDGYYIVSGEEKHGLFESVVFVDEYFPSVEMYG